MYTTLFEPASMTKTQEKKIVKPMKNAHNKGECGLLAHMALILRVNMFTISISVS